MYSSHSWLAAPSPMTRGSSLPFPNPDPSAPHDPPPPLAGVRPPARGWMDPPFVFPSSLRDLERDTDGDDEPSLRPQDTVAVAALRAADLEESSRVTCRRLLHFSNRAHFLFRSGVAPVLRNYVDFGFAFAFRTLPAENSTGIGSCWSVVLIGDSDLDG